MGNNSDYLKEEKPEQLKVSITPIGELPFDLLTIPPYQRPYKWTAKHVNQLISDLITFRTQQQYRLGTLVLYKNAIVDGQQRILTLALLIRVMFDCLEDDKMKSANQEFADKITKFSEQVSFSNHHSLHNIVENIHTIERRKTDFDPQLFDFLLTKCEFVVVNLDDLSEAFQFFDSQNARGKDLAPHDLLKAYHLREMSSLTEEESKHIDEWQKQPTWHLKRLFLTLFRAKRWSKGKTAKEFTKEHTDLFKGISLKDGKRYPFCQMEIMAHVFTKMYNEDQVRAIDNRHMAYPFNLDHQIINGGRFFEMISHYTNLYERVHQYPQTLPKGSPALEILKLITSYKGCERTGDRYVRSMFYTLLLYYVDRFGEEELDKIIPLFFIWAYKLRLELSAVRLASVDKYAAQWGSLFRKIHEAKTPYDLINVNIEAVRAEKRSGYEEIEQRFKAYNKYYDGKN